MPTPQPPRRPIRPNRNEPPDPAGAARAPGASRRRAAPPPKKPNKLPGVLMLVGGAVVVVCVVLIVMMKSGKPEPASAPTSTANAASTPPVEPAPAPEPVAPPAPPPKPKPSPLVIKTKIATAATVDEAAALAGDAETLGDAALIEKCWTRVFELDPTFEQAREKLEVRTIEPAKDFPGFAEIARTPQKVHLQPWYETAHAELTKAGRAEVIARWEEAHKTLEERIERARTDPFVSAVDQFRIDLQQKPFFSELQYEMVESKPPYALFVEVKGTPEERQKRRDEADKSYTPFLEAYDKKIRSYLFPLAPKPPPTDPIFPVFVFLDESRYKDYCVADKGHPPSPGMRAHYEPWKKQCFTYSPVLKVGYGAFAEGVQSLLHELTHAWVDQLASRDNGESRSIEVLASHWFSEGIAEYMSCEFLDRGSVQFQPWRSERVTGQYRPPGWRIVARDALAIPIHGLDAIAQLRVNEIKPDQRDAAIANISSGFYADMSNFILWLNLRSGANRAAQFDAYAKEELAGRGGMEAFERCVPGLLDEVKDIDGTIDEFVKKIANGKIKPWQELAEAEKSK